MAPLERQAISRFYEATDPQADIDIRRSVMKGDFLSVLLAAVLAQGSRSDSKST